MHMNAAFCMKKMVYFIPSYQCKRIYILLFLLCLLLSGWVGTLYEFEKYEKTRPELSFYRPSYYRFSHMMMMEKENDGYFPSIHAFQALFEKQAKRQESSDTVYEKTDAGSYKDCSWSRLSRKYTLYLYKEITDGCIPLNTITDIKSMGDLLSFESLLGDWPVLFLHGHGGCYKQVRLFGSETYRQSHLEKCPASEPLLPSFYGPMFWDDDGDDHESANAKMAPQLDFFTIDFNEDLSGVHTASILDQAEFANDAAQFILYLYYSLKCSRAQKNTPYSVVLLCHSMGGFVGRVMPILPNHSFLISHHEQDDTDNSNQRRGGGGTLEDTREISEYHSVIHTILTLNTPHVGPLMSLEPDIIGLYNKVNAYWRQRYALNSSHQAKRLKRDEELILVSIMSGIKDSTIHSDFSSLRNTIHFYEEEKDNGVYPRGIPFGLNVFTTNIPFVWMSMDHDTILWAHSFIRVVIRTLNDLVKLESQDCKEKATTRTLKLEIIKRHLLGHHPRETKQKVASSDIVMTFSVDEHLVTQEYAGMDKDASLQHPYLLLNLHEKMQSIPTPYLLLHIQQKDFGSLERIRLLHYGMIGYHFIIITHVKTLTRPRDSSETVKSLSFQVKLKGELQDKRNFFPFDVKHYPYISQRIQLQKAESSKTFYNSFIHEYVLIKDTALDDREAFPEMMLLISNSHPNHSCVYAQKDGHLSIPAFQPVQVTLGSTELTLLSEREVISQWIRYELLPDPVHHISYYKELDQMDIFQEHYTIEEKIKAETRRCYKDNQMHPFIVVKNGTCATQLKEYNFSSWYWYAYTLFWGTPLVVPLSAEFGEWQSFVLKGIDARFIVLKLSLHIEANERGSIRALTRPPIIRLTSTINSEVKYWVLDELEPLHVEQSVFYSPILLNSHYVHDSFYPKVKDNDWIVEILIIPSHTNASHEGDPFHANKDAPKVKVSMVVDVMAVIGLILKRYWKALIVLPFTMLCVAVYVGYCRWVSCESQSQNDIFAAITSSQDRTRPAYKQSKCQQAYPVASYHTWPHLLDVLWYDRELFKSFICHMIVLIYATQALHYYLIFTSAIPLGYFTKSDTSSTLEPFLLYEYHLIMNILSGPQYPHFSFALTLLLSAISYAVLVTLTMSLELGINVTSSIAHQWSLTRIKRAERTMKRGGFGGKLLSPGWTCRDGRELIILGVAILLTPYPYTLMVVYFIALINLVQLKVQMIRMANFQSYISIYHFQLCVCTVLSFTYLLNLPYLLVWLRDTSAMMLKGYIVVSEADSWGMMAYSAAKWILLWRGKIYSYDGQSDIYVRLLCCIENVLKTLPILLFAYQSKADLLRLQAVKGDEENIDMWERTGTIGAAKDNNASFSSIHSPEISLEWLYIAPSDRSHRALLHGVTWLGLFCSYGFGYQHTYLIYWMTYVLFALFCVAKMRNGTGRGRVGQDKAAHRTIALL